MSDVIVVMRDGRIQQQGAPEALYERPVNRYVAGFVGLSNFVPARLTEAPAGGRCRLLFGDGRTAAGVLTDPQASVAADTDVTIAIRPERLRIAPARSGTSATGAAPDRAPIEVPGRIRQGTYLGDQTEYRVETDALGELVVRHQNAGSPDGGRLGPGDPVVVSWHEDANLVLAS